MWGVFQQVLFFPAPCSKRIEAPRIPGGGSSAFACAELTLPCPSLCPLYSSFRSQQASFHSTQLSSFCPFLKWSYFPGNPLKVSSSSWIYCALSWASAFWGCVCVWTRAVLIKVSLGISTHTQGDRDAPQASWHHLEGKSPQLWAANIEPLNIEKGDSAAGR